MNQRARLFLLLGGAALVSVGAIVACSDQTNNTLPQVPNTPAKDSGQSDSGEEEEDLDAAPAGDCGKTPFSNDKGVYCFGAGNCDPGKGGVCCSSKDKDGNFANACASLNTGDAGDGGADAGEGGASGPPTEEKAACQYTTGSTAKVQYDCLNAGHCASGACCVIKGSKGFATIQSDKKEPACAANSNSDGTFVGGTRCKDTCEDGELHLCATDDECAEGETCIYFKLSNRGAGVCQASKASK